MNFSLIQINIFFSNFFVVILKNCSQMDQVLILSIIIYSFLILGACLYLYFECREYLLVT